jgi:hypothetical protein
MLVVGFLGGGGVNGVAASRWTEGRSRLMLRRRESHSWVAAAEE